MATKNTRSTSTLEAGRRLRKRTIKPGIYSETKTLPSRGGTVKSSSKKCQKTSRPNSNIGDLVKEKKDLEIRLEHTKDLLELSISKELAVYKDKILKKVEVSTSKKDLVEQLQEIKKLSEEEKRHKIVAEEHWKKEIRLRERFEGQLKKETQNMKKIEVREKRLQEQVKSLLKEQSLLKESLRNEKEERDQRVECEVQRRFDEEKDRLRMFVEYEYKQDLKKLLDVKKDLEYQRMILIAELQAQSKANVELRNQVQIRQERISRVIAYTNHWTKKSSVVPLKNISQEQQESNGHYSDDVVSNC